MADGRLISNLRVNMYFHEAATTGRSFRRPGWKHWIAYNEKNSQYEWDHGSSIILDLRPEWFEHDDWEVKWEPVTVTAGEFWSAYADALKGEVMHGSLHNATHIALDRVATVLAEKLGLRIKK